MSARSRNFSFEDATTRSRHVALNSAIMPETTMAAAAVTARALEFRRGSGRHTGRASVGRSTAAVYGRRSTRLVARRGFGTCGLAKRNGRDDLRAGHGQRDGPAAREIDRRHAQSFVERNEGERPIGAHEEILRRREPAGHDPAIAAALRPELELAADEH